MLKKIQMVTYIFCIVSAIASIAVCVIECKNLYWQGIVFLPVTFLGVCIIVATFIDLIYKSIFITLMGGIYWLRLVLTPIIMCFANFKVVPVNTDWEEYLPKAFALECYETIVVFLILYMFAKKIRKLNNNLYSYKQIRYSYLFKTVMFVLLLFALIMFTLWPSLIRYFFVTIFGAPNTWYVNVEQRSLSGVGTGPLGVFVTALSYLIVIFQMILPAIIMTYILNKKNRNLQNGHSQRKASCRFIISSFILIGITVFIATESRANSVIAATCLIFTMMAYSNEEEKRVELIIFVLLFVFAFGAFVYKAKYQSSLNTTGGIGMVSQVISEYFGGPQNIAASVKATENNNGPDLKYVVIDILNHLPYGNFFLTEKLAKMDSSTILFNRALYDMNNREWDQIIPAIGQGYLWFGGVLASLNPAIMVVLGCIFELKAKKAKSPIYKYVYTWGLIWMGFGIGSDNLSLGCSFLWYIIIVLVIDAASYFYIDSIPGDRQSVAICHGLKNEIEAD